MRIIDSKANDKPEVRLDVAAKDAGCTVDDILKAAADMRVRLHVALGRFSYTVRGHRAPTPPELTSDGEEQRHPAFPGGSAPSAIWPLLSCFAADLLHCGRAEVAMLPFPDVPEVPGLWFMYLDEPQSVDLSRIWVAKGHITKGTVADDGALPEVRLEWTKKRTAVTDDRIIEALHARGIDPLKMPGCPLGNKPWSLREEIMEELHLSKNQAKEAFTRLRKEGRMSS